MHLSAGIADRADLRIVPTVTRYAFRSGRFLRATSAQSSPGLSENSRSSRKRNRSPAGLPVVDRRLRPGEYLAGFGQANITAKSIDIGVDRVVRPQRNPHVVVAGGDRPSVRAKRHGFDGGGLVGERRAELPMARAKGPRRDLRRQAAGRTDDARIALLLGAVYGRVKARREDPSHPVVLDGGGAMSALTVVKVSGDIGRFRQALLERGDEFAKFTEEAKSKGALHHRFGIGDGFVLVVDEWQDADAFMQFFSNPELQTFIASVGGDTSTPPDITLTEAISSPDEF